MRKVAGYALDDAPERRASGFGLFRGTRVVDGARVFVEVSEHGPSSSASAKLRREHALLVELAMPGAVRPVELVVDGPRCALVLEDPGLPFLEELRAEGPLEPALAARVAASAARVLDELHRRGFVHGDVCPKNLLVDRETGAVVLAGFSSAVRLARRGAEAKDALREGALVYAAPERAGRTARGFDGRADLYSLGVVLYEMLTGAPPFVFDDPLELSHAHLARAPVPVHEHRDGISPALSAITDKLLAKAPFDRYRTGRGLAHDLERAAREGAGAEPFPLGQKDAPDERRIRDKPIGRESESGALARAVARVAEGGVELVLVVGPTGAGKSLFVGGARESITQQGGLFASGKFEPGAAPYAAFGEVLGQLGRRVLAEPEERLAAVRERLGVAAVEGGRLLTDLSPALELVLGETAPLAELGPVEARHRIERVVREALRAFREDRPVLVLFFDDLADADPASLSLLGALLADRECPRLCVVGAIHEEDAAPGKPLRVWLSDLAKKKGVAISRIVLAPLGAADVARVLADVLGGEPEELLPLARAVNEKARGNPFSVVQTIEALLAEGLVDRDPQTLALRWDERRIREAPIASDAALLVADRMRKLSPTVSRMLGAAACVGNVFELDSVAVALSAQNVDEISGLVAVAVDQGMIVPLDAEGRRDYAFVHEKVREAALSLIRGGERMQMHLALARSLSAEGISSDERLFEVARHYGEARSLVDSRDERRRASAFALAAGRKARDRAAFPAAAGFYATGLELASAEIYEDDPGLAYALHEERAECEWLNGRYDIAEELFSKALLLARTSAERARVFGQRLAQRTTQARYAEAIEAGRDGLSELGGALPTPGHEGRLVPSRLEEIERLLGGRSPTDLAGAPPIEDPVLLGRLDLLIGLIAPTYISDTALYFVVILEVVAICVEHGHTDVAPYAYAVFALVLAWIRHDFAAARGFFELALLLEERTTSVVMRGKVAWAIAAAGVNFMHLRRALPFVQRALRHSIEAGDAPYISYSLHLDVTYRLWMGEPLSSVRESWDKAMTIMPSVQDPMGSAVLRAAHRMIEALIGRTRAPTSFDGSDFDDARFVTEIEAGLPYAACIHHALLAELHFIHGQIDDAHAWIVRAEERMGAALWLHLETVIVFVGALIRIALVRKAAPDEADADRTRLFALAARLDAFAELCPDNHLHEALLVRAEIASLDPARRGEARELYDEAIDAARKNGFSQHEAIANELAGRHYVERGKLDLARPYLAAAARSYSRWGAQLKADELRLAFPDIAVPSFVPLSRAPSGQARPSGSLDAVAIVRAAEAIAGEIDIERLLERLFAVVLEVAGADRGALVLSKEGALVVAATMTVAGATLCDMSPLAEFDGLASSVVQYVARTRTPVVLGRGASGSPFEADPHLVVSAPRSLLGLPLVHKGALTGVLYLENKLVEEAFSEGRVEVLGLLSSQAAIAIENALLVADVRRRTEELRAANSELRGELSRRAELEREREALEGEVIAMQRARLAELSAPLVPITDRLAVIPLVGTVDAARADDLMQVALAGTSLRGLEVLILDVTGVADVDAGVAERLIAAVRAVELLGAEVVVTGIRGEVARRLVSLDIDFGTKVKTRSTLHAGITHAFQRSRRARGGAGSS